MASLSISSSGGTQTTTQSPQNLVSPDSSTEAATSVQPGVSNVQPETSSSPSGIALHPTQLPVVNVNTSAGPVSSSSSSTVAVDTKPKHHINAGLLGASIGLFIVAVVIFWLITKSAKNTTNYK